MVWHVPLGFLSSLARVPPTFAQVEKLTRRSLILEITCAVDLEGAEESEVFGPLRVLNKVDYDGLMLQGSRTQAS